MMLITGCTILRDKKGNPGEMILHRREATKEEMDAMSRKMMAVAAMLTGGEHRTGAHAGAPLQGEQAAG